ncbi:MAG: ABC transporter ATP-binding protein [Acidobacteriota bacterium]|nr:MAG: ABC transporter ATP-binding protein [Acidobacteriota bacterium]
MIELRNITKTVTSGTEALTILDDVSINIPDGQFVAVTGASGSGKSTLLGLIAGLDAPSSGEIVVDGSEVTAMPEDALAKLRSEKIGFVFQSFHLIPSLTAYENIIIPMEILGSENAEQRTERLLEAVGLTERGHHYPSELSGGEQQRVAIARAFANRPKILLADEPTGNLDSKNGQHIFDLMKDLHRQNGITLVLVTHDDSLARQAQRQVVLKDGRVVEDIANSGEAAAR